MDKYRQELEQGESCSHHRCLNRVTHPCEGYEQIAGRTAKQEQEPVYAFRRKGLANDFVTCSKELYEGLSETAMFDVAIFYKDPPDEAARIASLQNRVAELELAFNSVDATLGMANDRVAELEAQRDELARDFAEVDSEMKAVHQELEDVDYQGFCHEGIRVLKAQLTAIRQALPKGLVSIEAFENFYLEVLSILDTVKDSPAQQPVCDKPETSNCISTAPCAFCPHK